MMAEPLPHSRLNSMDELTPGSPQSTKNLGNGVDVPELGSAVCISRDLQPMSDVATRQSNLRSLSAAESPERFVLPRT
jgi:hypothetical protein